MYTSLVALMDVDKGTLTRIDRKLLADDDAYRTVSVPAIGTKWSTRNRYCDSVGISMGRAIVALTDRELLDVFGESAGEYISVLARRAQE